MWLVGWGQKVMHRYSILLFGTVNCDGKFYYSFLKVISHNLLLGDSSNPFMTLVPAREQYTNTVVFATPTAVDDSYR